MLKCISGGVRQRCMCFVFNAKTPVVGLVDMQTIKYNDNLKKNLNIDQVRWLLLLFFIFLWWFMSFLKIFYTDAFIL